MHCVRLQLGGFEQAVNSVVRSQKQPKTSEWTTPKQMPRAPPGRAKGAEALPPSLSQVKVEKKRRSFNF